MNQNELISLLSSSSSTLNTFNATNTIQKLEQCCIIFAKQKHLLSASFYPVFPLLLQRLFVANGSPSIANSTAASASTAATTAPSSASLSSATLPPSSTSSANSFIPLIRATQSILPFLSPSGALFTLLFLHAPFPPRFLLPLSILPSPTSTALRQPSSSPSTFLSSSYRSSFKATADALEVTIQEQYLFFFIAYLPNEFNRASQCTIPVSSTSKGVYSAEESLSTYLEILQAYLNTFVPFSSSISSSSASPASSTFLSSSSITSSAPNAPIKTTSVSSSSSQFRLKEEYGNTFLQIVAELFLCQNFYSNHSPTSFASSTTTMYPSITSSSSTLSSSESLFSKPSSALLRGIQTFLHHLLNDSQLQKVASSPYHTDDLYHSLSKTLLCASGIDVLFFRFFRTCFRQWRGPWDTALNSVIECFHDFIQPIPTTSTSPTPSLSQAYILYFLPFYSILLSDLLQLLLSTEVAREGTTSRLQSLRTLSSLLETYRHVAANVTRGEKALLEKPSLSAFASPSALTQQKAAKTFGYGSASITTSSSIHHLTPNGTSTANRTEVSLLQKQWQTFSLVRPEECRPVFYKPPEELPTDCASHSAELLRLLAPTAVKSGLARSWETENASDARSSTPATPHSHPHTPSSSSLSSFQSNLLSEERAWDSIRAACQALWSVSFNVGDISSQGRVSNINAAEIRPNALYPDRISNDPIHRLTASGRKQLKEGIRLCSRREEIEAEMKQSRAGWKNFLFSAPSAGLVWPRLQLNKAVTTFDIWAEPVCSYELEVAIRLGRWLHYRWMKRKLLQNERHATTNHITDHGTDGNPNNPDDATRIASNYRKQYFLSGRWLARTDVFVLTLVIFLSLLLRLCYM